MIETTKAVKDNPLKRGGMGQSEVSIQQRYKTFVHEYVANGCNGTQAAIKAGYAPSSAAAAAGKLLHSPLVRLLIDEFLERQAARTGLNAERVLNEVRRVAFADMRKLYRPDGTLKSPAEWDDDTAAMVAAVESVEIAGEKDATLYTKKVKLWDKNSALEKAMKHLGMFERDNAQRSENIQIQIAVVEKAHGG